MVSLWSHLWTGRRAGDRDPQSALALALDMAPNSYRQLTNVEKEKFRLASAMGLDVRHACGVCTRKTVVIREIPRFCEAHVDWEPYATEVRCYRCRVVYQVLIAGRCKVPE